MNNLLFGFIPANKEFDHFWDWTSLQLKKNIKSYFKPSMNFLDMGTGPYGLLAMYVSKKLLAESVTGIDYLKVLLDNAKKQVRSENIFFLESDLFEDTSEKYDFIVFNAPYIAKDFGLKMGVIKDELSQKRWSGGINATSTIKRFLSELYSYLTDDGICLLGVNHFFIEHNILLEMINDNQKIILVDFSKNSTTKSAVYIIKRKTYEMF